MKRDELQKNIDNIFLYIINSSERDKRIVGRVKLMKFIDEYIIYVIGNEQNSILINQEHEKQKSRAGL